MVALETRRNGRRPTKPPAPDAAYIQSLKSFVETHYADQDEQIDMMRRVRELEDPPVITEELKVAGVDTVLQDPTITDELSLIHI